MHEGRLDELDALVVFVGAVEVSMKLGRGLRRRGRAILRAVGALDRVPEVQSLGDVLLLVDAGVAEGALGLRAVDQIGDAVRERIGAALFRGRGRVELERERAGERFGFRLLVDARQVDRVAEAAACWRLRGGCKREREDDIFGVQVLSCARELVWCAAVAVLLRVCFGCWAAFCSSV